MHINLFCGAILSVGMFLSNQFVEQIDKSSSFLVDDKLKEVFKNSKKDDISGVYAVVGYREVPGGKKSNYKVIVTLSRVVNVDSKEIYVANCLSGSSHYSGLAIRTGDKIALSWKLGNDVGTSLFTLNENGTFGGTWVSHEALGEETYTPVEMPKNWIEFNKKSD